MPESKVEGGRGGDETSASRAVVCLWLLLPGIPAGAVRAEAWRDLTSLLTAH